MRGVRRVDVFLLIATTGMLGTPPVQATGMSRSPTPTLRGSTTIRALESSAMSVRVGEETQIRLRGVGLNSEGGFPRMLAIGLFEEEGGEPLPQGDYFISGATRSCLDAKCRRRATVRFRAGTRDPSGSIRISAGRYRLVVITQGKPLTFELAASALAGRETLRPQDEQEVDFKNLSLRKDHEEGTHTYWGGSAFASGKFGFAGATALVDPRRSPTLTEFGFCSYAGPVAMRDPDAYQPDCSDAPREGLGAGANATRRIRSTYAYTFLFRYTPNSFPPNLDEGKRGLGAWVRTDRALRAVRLSAFVLSLG